MSKYTIAILGAGPGGYVAALRAARLGATVALIEKDEVGGVCLNRGCIPTKSMVASVNMLREIKRSAEFGINCPGEPGFSVEQIISRKNKIVSNLVKGIHQLIKASKIDYIRGDGHIKSAKEIEVGEKIIEADNIIIATGSEWKSIPGIDIDGEVIVTSDGLLNIDSIPEKMVVIGGGVVGSEYASIFSGLGSEVTIVEAMPNLIPTDDMTISKSIEKAFKKAKVRVVTGTTVENIQREGKRASLKLSSGEELRADKVLVSVGRGPNITGFGLEELGVEIEKGAVVTDERMKTNIDGIYAIGDVNGKYMLAHTASREAIVAVDNIMGKGTVMSYRAVPRPIFTYPEACSVGRTEKELQDRGTRYKTGRFSYLGLAKAVCDGIRDGQVTVYADAATDKIIGAALFGKYATDIAGELVLAIENGLTIEDVASTIHSHPTISEIVAEAVEDCNGMAIHKVVRRS